MPLQLFFVGLFCILVVIFLRVTHPDSLSLQFFVIHPFPENLVQNFINRLNFQKTSGEGYYLGLVMNGHMFCPQRGYNEKLCVNEFTRLRSVKGNFHQTTGIPNSSSYCCCLPVQHLQEAGPSQKVHEKCIFETLHNEMKCILSVKESNFHKKRIKLDPVGSTVCHEMMKLRTGSV